MIQVIDKIGREVQEIAPEQMSRIMRMLKRQVAEQQRCEALEEAAEEHKEQQSNEQRTYLLEAADLLQPTWCYLPPVNELDLDKVEQVLLSCAVV